MKATKSCGFPGAKFKVDYADYLAQYAVVCERPIIHGYDALLIGGGDLTGVAWNPDDCFKMIVNKSDILTRRAAAASPYCGSSGDVNIPVHAGALKITGSAGLFSTPDEFRFEQSVFDGVISLKAVKGVDEIEIQAWVAFGTNVLVLRVKPGARAKKPFVLELYRTVNRDYGQAPEFGREGNSAWIHYCGVQDARYCLAMRTIGEQLFENSAGGVRAVIPRGGATFILAAATQNESDDVVATARSKIQEFTKTGLAKKFTSHQSRWLDYWRRSFIHTSQYYLNNLWYLHLYHMAISSQGMYPVKFNGALFTWREDDYRLWGGGFWSLNQTRSYSGLFNSDHMELMDNMYKLLKDYLPEAREKTRHHFGIDGVWLPEITKPWANSISPSVDDFGKRVKDARFPTDKSINTWNRAAAAQWGILFWRRYKMTGDLEFLRDYAFPLLKGAADFYAGYVVKKKDGKYHIPDAMAAESWPVGEDSISDLACMQWLFPAVIEAAVDLREDLPEAVLYRKIIKHLAPYPEVNGIYTHIKYKGRPFDVKNVAIDWRGGRERVSRMYMWQNASNYPVFPWGVVGRDSGNVEQARRTYWSYRYNNDFAAGDCFIPAARLGLKDETYRHLYNTIAFNQTMKQGLFIESYDSHYPDQAQKNLRHMTYLDGNGSFAQLVNEAFLQGHCGFIDIFPAFPDEWAGNFSLLCEGGFLVSGKILEGGKIQYAALHSRLGNDCRVLNPWRGKPCLTELKSGRAVKYELKKKILSFSTEKSKTYILESKRGMYENQKMEVFKAELKPCAKMLGRAILGQGKSYIHQNTWSVW